ncbi:MAG: hypothetical protein RL267_353 [Chloroflexota bacterium]
MLSIAGSWVIGLLLGLLLTVFVAVAGIGPHGSSEPMQSPASAAATARGYASAASSLSEALAASDDAFDQAWTGGDADWTLIGTAADESAAIIEAAQVTYAAELALLPTGPEEAELVKFADLFDQAAAATRACVGVIQQSVQVKSREIYFASFPCFTASNSALAEARANLNELLEMLGVPLEI